MALINELQVKLEETLEELEGIRVERMEGMLECEVEGLEELARSG